MNTLENINDDLFETLDHDESQQLIGGLEEGTNHATAEVTYGPTGTDAKVDVKIDI